MASVTPWLGLVVGVLVSGAPDGGVAAGGCARARDCAVAADGGCAPSAWGQGPVSESGVACDCRAGACVPFTVAPVPCRSFRDCSYASEPVLHPVSSKATPRPFKGKVRPCRDAERDSVCDEGTKTCRLVAWKC